MLAEVRLTGRNGSLQGSGIANLAASLFLSRDWRASRLMALTAYFDASGHEDDQKYLVVAGFLSSATEWIEFDGLWSARLAREGIEYFNAGEFAHSKGQFDGWRGDEPRRQALSADLMAILKPRVFRRFGHVVVNEAMAQMSDQTKEVFLVNAYSLAGRGCAADLRMYLAQNKWETSPELVFEDGDKGKGKLRDALLRDGFAEPLFKPKQDRVLKNGLTELGVVPLQAADWLAHELFQAAKAQDINKRWAMREFETTPGRIGYYGEDDVRALEVEINTPLDKIMEPIPGDHFYT